MRGPITLAIAATGLSLVCAGSAQASVYLNKDLITVAVGAGTSSGTFNNTFTNSPGLTIEKVIDAPTAASAEFHNQDTHIWFTAANPGGGLELLFDFQAEYDISTLHFWNYDSESYDVDNVDFTFFNSANAQVGALSAMPALGSSPAIFAEDITLAAPLNVRYVKAFLTGTNREVDFQNIGFTANVSAPVNAVPEPATWAMMLFGFGLVGSTMRRRAATRVSATV
jgi:PEP-CTERM motif